MQSSNTPHLTPQAIVILTSQSNFVGQSLDAMCSTYMHAKLSRSDSIRLLELRRSGPDSTIHGSLVECGLEDTPHYYALSYTWGDASPSDPTLQVNNTLLRITKSLFQALDHLMSDATTMIIWVDQICIDQENDPEREQQVRLMSRIFIQAQRVICWLGLHEANSNYAFDLLDFLVLNQSDPKVSADWEKAANRLWRAGFLDELQSLFNPANIPFAAAAALANRSWFSRLWIVQEVALASELEFRCGDSTLSGTTFFTAMQTLSSVVHDPPMPWLLKPFRHAVRLGQLRAQVAAGKPLSFPHTAQALSTWSCKKSHDRLNALFGLLHLRTPERSWFLPSYSITSPELFVKFATGYIQHNHDLNILHFAGCGDVEVHELSQAYDTTVFTPGVPADDVPSWVPDWRVQSRPLVLSPYPEHDFEARFAATVSTADYTINEGSRTLRVRALLVDEILICGPPYYSSFCRTLQITEHDIFGLWFNLVKDHLGGDGFESMFASTMTMDGRVTLKDYENLKLQPEEIFHSFKHWAYRNVYKETLDNNHEHPHQTSDASARFGYTAEEVCRNRALFLTKGGRLGLGSTHVSPGASIYLLHGLKTPFVVHTGSGKHILRGECYVHGLMDRKASVSCQDVYLDLA